MTDAAARQRLPHAYALALSLRDAGVDDLGIAIKLDIAVESVRPLLVLGEAKLARLLDEEDASDEGNDDDAAGPRDNGSGT